MNEEEKKAIEILKEIEINTYAEGKATAIDTVLKLIKKLQKENEELKNQEAIQRKINELVQAVKQLNKEVKELENRSIGNEV